MRNGDASVAGLRGEVVRRAVHILAEGRLPPNVHGDRRGRAESAAMDGRARPSRQRSAPAESGQLSCGDFIPIFSEFLYVLSVSHRRRSLSPNYLLSHENPQPHIRTQAYIHSMTTVRRARAQYSSSDVLLYYSLSLHSVQSGSTALPWLSF